MGFRRDINGLRALAVVLVVLYHLRVPGLSGGYVGVDVFFVISGYLMTQVIVSKLEAARFSAADFYAARLRRLMPALIVLEIAVLIGGAILLLPSAFVALSESVVTSMSFTSNLGFWRDRGYFDGPSQTKWLLHTWSLSVEWQFYLLYPVFLAALHRLGKLRAVKAGVAVVGLASLALSIIATPWKPEAAFFLLPTRIWELLLGAVIFLWPRARGVRGAAPLGIVLIAISAVTYGEGLAYPGHYAVLPVAGAALVLLGKSEGPLLDNRVAQFLGDTSYSFYLWHWPFIAALASIGYALDVVTTLVVLAVSLGAATLSHRFVEERFRRAGAELAPLHYIARIVVISSPVLAAAVAVVALKGVPARVPPLAAANDAIGARFVYEETCGARVPCTLEATAGAASSTRAPVLFWGDSHAQQLLPVARALGGPAVFITESACPPVRRVRAVRGLRAGGTCDAFADSAFERALTSDAGVVVIASIWTPYLREILYDPASAPTLCGLVVDADGKTTCPAFATLEEGLAFMKAELAKDVAALVARGKRVVLVAPVPIFPENVAHHLARRAQSDELPTLELTRARHDELHMSLAAALRDVAKETGARLLDPADTLCASGRCVFRDDAGLSLYRDNNHLGESGALLLVPAFREALAAP